MKRVGDRLEIESVQRLISDVFGAVGALAHGEDERGATLGRVQSFLNEAWCELRKVADAEKE